MPVLSGIYDSDWIQPIARFKENISILTAGSWKHFQVRYQEPIPPGQATVVNFGVAAANATIQKQVAVALQLNPDEFLHLRFAPLDYLEVVLWELSGVAKFNSKNVQARVDPNTVKYDPRYSLTTFGIYGQNRDANIEVRNPLGYAQPTSRVLFWGFRYLLSEIENTKTGQSIKNLHADARAKLSLGDREAVSAYIGPTTWFPAEGMGG